MKIRQYLTEIANHNDFSKFLLFFRKKLFYVRFVQRLMICIVRSIQFSCKNCNDNISKTCFKLNMSYIHSWKKLFCCGTCNRGLLKQAFIKNCFNTIVFLALFLSTFKKPLQTLWWILRTQIWQSYSCFLYFQKKRSKKFQKLKNIFEVFNLINAKLNLFVNMLYLVNCYALKCLKKQWNTLMSVDLKRNVIFFIKLINLV